MDKKMKNNLFMVAVDHLFKEGLVDSQKSLAEKIGISEAALSRIKNGSKTVSDETLRKMNAAFDGIFNMAYFRAESTKLLIEDVDYYLQHPEQDLLAGLDKELKRQAMKRNNNPSINSDEVKKMKEQVAKLKTEMESMQKIIDEKDHHIYTLKQEQERLWNLIDKLQISTPTGVREQIPEWHDLSANESNGAKDVEFG